MRIQANGCMHVIDRYDGFTPEEGTASGPFLHLFRIRKFVSIFLAVLFILGSASCGKSKSRFEADYTDLFDTVTKIIAYLPDQAGFDALSQLIYANLKEYHQLYDIYHTYTGISNLKTVNDNAGIAPVKVDRRIIDLLQFAKEKYQLTGGKCNIAFGAVLKIWNSYRENGIADPGNAKLPPRQELQDAARHSDINKVVIDETNSTVFLTDPKMSLDVGAVAKGYAVEQVCLLAQQNGYTSALVSAGGNVRAIGYRLGSEEEWKVGIQNPDTENAEVLATVGVANRSVVTSGDYERYYTVNGTRYCHIIDSATLFPPTYYRSVTIIGADSGLADALSTAVFCMPPDTARAFIEGLSGIEALWVLPDGTLVYSSGFKNYLQ